MIDKICCMIYKAINLIGWIVCNLIYTGITFVIISVPYLGCRYVCEIPAKDSIIVTIAFWTSIGFARIIGAAYVRGKKIKQEADKE